MKKIIWSIAVMFITVTAIAGNTSQEMNDCCVKNSTCCFEGSSCCK